MTNKNNTTLYVGVCSDLQSRVIQYKEKHFPNSFTAKYNLDKLVYYRDFDHIESAIMEEKRIKASSRVKKIKLIEEKNPEWRDLFEAIKEW